jgi:hypothetical protein
VAANESGTTGDDYILHSDSTLWGIIDFSVYSMYKYSEKHLFVVFIG